MSKYSSWRGVIERVRRGMANDWRLSERVEKLISQLSKAKIIPLSPPF